MKTITMKTPPEKIFKQFKKVLDKGGSINLKTKRGFLYITGTQPNSILCKIEDGIHYTYQRDRKMWVEL